MALNFQLEFSTTRKSFGVKTISPLERTGKNLLLYVFCFFLRNSEYDYERVEQSVFCTKNASRAPAGWFLEDAPIYKSICTNKNSFRRIWPAF